jgi:hypothetical protein
MANAIEVSDSLSNAEEQIERAARVIGRGARQKVFDAIYHHKMRVKSASEIVKRIRLRRVRVLQEGRHLCRHGIARSATKDGETAYEMIDFFHSHKRKILRYMANPKKLTTLATKRRPAVTVRVTRTRGISYSRPSAKKISIDDIDSFSAVKKVKAEGNLPDSVSETAFKLGVQAILRDPADWKDWGGELFDLASTRVVFKGKRIPTVIAFKGPGTKGPLVPGKMGKNGDQIPRMFFGDGRLFTVQFWRDIRPSIDTLMRSMAIDKSNATGERIYYSVVDGVDSHRLYRAYPAQFVARRKPSKGKTRSKRA